MTGIKKEDHFTLVKILSVLIYSGINQFASFRSVPLNIALYVNIYLKYSPLGNNLPNFE